MYKLAAVAFAFILLTTAGYAQISGGNVFVGYSYMSADLVSGSRTNLNGWNGSVEGKVLPFVGIVLARARRRTSAVQRERLVRVASASYATLTALLLWQALRGQPIVAPDAVTLIALAVWALATVAAAASARAGRAAAAASLIPLVME